MLIWKRRRRRRRRLHMSITDPKRLPESFWAANRQDSIDAPITAGRQFRELKKLIFSAPRKCPIDLFGPQMDGTILERLHVALYLKPSMSQARAPRKVCKAALRRIGAIGACQILEAPHLDRCGGCRSARGLRPCALPNKQSPTQSCA